MPDDLKILEPMLEGLETKGKELREKESLFIKAQGLDESIQRNNKEKQSLESSLETLKEDLKALKADKKKAVDSVAETICAKLNDFLPIGESFFDASEALSFGWIYDDTKQPYYSLSGAQKSIFDAALSNLLGSNIQIIEAAEIDNQHLTGLLEDLSDIKKQIFINTCHEPATLEVPHGFVVPKEFEIVKV